MMLKRIINKIISYKGIRKITRIWAYKLEEKRIKKDLEGLPERCKWNKQIEKITYIRSDLWLKNDSPNGAVAHTEGIVNALVRKGIQVNIFTTYPLSFLKTYNSMTVCEPNGLFNNISELDEMEYSRQLVRCMLKKNQKEDLVYQRYGRNNYSGLMYARKKGIPLILEYNGSEIWMSKNWGKRLRYEKMANEIELAVLKGADMIVANAQALKDELIARGVEDNRILIIPNGVDQTKFHPDIDGTGIRESLNVAEDDIVVSFVGSFGPWHGSEILAKSIKHAIPSNPRLKYLFIGEGAKLQSVKNIVENDKVSQYAYFLGYIGREHTPGYLAASDILVSPQVPNPDGTPFFGSPTKLFEYMAMGKAIVASNLDQIGEILSNGDNAILVQPDEAEELAQAILKLSNDKELREKIGKKARIDAVEKYSWDYHVDMIFKIFSSIYKN